MNMDRLLNKRIVKQTVKDLKEKLEDADDDAEVVLAFYLKDGERHICCYLGEVLTTLKYDGVIGERLENSTVVELGGFDDRYCTYMEKKQ